jgi:hypothetical protein
MDLGVSLTKFTLSAQYGREKPDLSSRHRRTFRVRDERRHCIRIRVLACVKETQARIINILQVHAH